MYRLLLFFCLINTTAFSQSNPHHEGYMIYLLGPDTTMAGFYSLKGNLFEVEVVARPNVSFSRLTGTLNAKGELQTAEGYSYKPVPGADSQLIVRYRLYVMNDSTIIEQMRGKEITRQKFKGQGMTANGIGVAFRYMLPFWPVYAPQKIGDSVVSGHLTLGSNKKLTMTRTAPDRILAGSTVMGMVTLHLNKHGRLVHIDGLGSSWNAIAKVTASINLRQLAERYASDERSGTGLKTINQADSVIARIDDATIRIHYSRPQVRGRVIFGSVVPWNRWWRTGANAATRLSTDKPLYFDGKELPAGAYSIFTIPSKDSWIIMFNTQPDIWGTEYNPAFDLLRIPMQAVVASFNETMTISIQGKTGQGELVIHWEKIKATAVFSTRK